ncbi:hypothetical protein GGR13_003222 [Brevundimonas variabilis]|uniref:Uncharacterized protein n=1 Tax=Brevundimonas variabilis TaxID=74312 RepID=A0A7W9CL46_9CAUL|nr:hypothetical protein [Brevundimonas variabilis]
MLSVHRKLVSTANVKNRLLGSCFVKLISCEPHRFPADAIPQAEGLYFRFNLIFGLAGN